MPKCLYKAANLSSFASCFKRSIDIASEVSGSISDISPILLVSGCCNHHNLRLLELMEYLLYQRL